MKLTAQLFMLALSTKLIEASENSHPRQDYNPVSLEKVSILSTNIDGESKIDSSSRNSRSPHIKTKAPSEKKSLAEDQTPRQVKMLLSKGKEYFGYVVGKDMHGQGTLTYADGTVYEGNFEHNKRHGRGRIRYASGEEYRGEWFRGFMTGKGTYNFQDGSVYEVNRFGQSEIT